MKLRIENDSAKFACFPLTIFNKPNINQDQVTLNFKLEPQKLANWCWAALAVSAAKYYGTGKWEQHQIASAVLGTDCSNYEKDVELKNKCNVCTKLDKPLEYVKCFSHWSVGKPNLARIQYEINHGNPICVRIEWFTGGAHYLLINGYNLVNDQIHLLDSLHGTSIHPFQDFPENYTIAGGVWTETFWMAKNKTDYK